jgi:predicted 2-oxoglutarate/Fe(II)-dependent dioxygenase YbiX
MDKVSDFIYVQNVIPQQVCQDILNEIRSKPWQKHSWYNYSASHYKSEPEKELDTQNCTEAMQEKLMPFIFQIIEQYMIKFAPQEGDRLRSFVNTFTPIRFNRYLPGTMMRKHYDHIHSIFDGQYKGIPILSALGVLNDGYEGGEFMFFDTYEVPLKGGDIMIFPSNFMYPHEVKEMTKGERYTFVAWAF